VPKQLLELKNFLGGISGSPSDTDIPANNAAYSENIDGITVEGRLQGVEGDMVLDEGGFSTRLNQEANQGFLFKRSESNPFAQSYAHILAHVIDWDESSDPGVTSSFDINTLTNASAFLIEHQEEALITPENLSSFSGDNFEFVDSNGYVQKATITHIIAASTVGQYIIRVNVDSLRLISGSQITSASGTNGNRIWFGGNKQFIHPGEYFQWAIGLQDYYIWFEDSAAPAGEKGSDPNTNNLLNTLTGNNNSPIGFKVSVDLRAGADGGEGSGVTTEALVTAVNTAIGSTYNSEFTHEIADSIAFGNTIIRFISNKDGKFIYIDGTNKIFNFSFDDAKSGVGTLLNISTMKSFKDFQDGSKTNIIYHNRISNTINIIEDIYNEVPSFVSPISAALDINPDFTIARRNIFFGTGNTASSIPKVYSRINHTRLNNLTKENLLTDSRNLPLSYEDSSLNSFDDIMLFPIYGLGEQQMTDKDGGNTWNNAADVFPDYDIHFAGDSGVSLYTELTDDSSGDLASLSPGQVFRLNGTTDDSGGDLVDWKRFNYDDNDDIVDNDLFMFVGLGADDTPIVQFVGSAGGSANEPVPAFSFGIKKGSSVISRISLTTQADDDSLDGTASFNISHGSGTTSFTQLGKRITHLDLKDLGLGQDESITSIAPCLSAPVNNNIGLKGSPSVTHTEGSTASDLFFDNGHRKIFYRHNVFWVGTIDSAGKSRLYRANLIDFDQLTLNNDPKLEEINLNYSKIPSTLEAKCGDDDDYAIDNDTAPASGGIIPRLPGSMGANKPSDWDSQWIRKPEDIGAQLIGIVETNESGLISNLETSVTAYTDDTGAPVDGIIEFTARRHRSESYDTDNPSNSKKTVRLTTGDKVRFAGLDDGTDGRKTFNKAAPYTVRMTDNNKFVIDDGGYTPSLPSTNNTYWWNTKTWLLFKMPSEATRDGFEQWDLFLYNFNPLDINSSKTVFVADRTVPYSQAGWMNFNDEKTYYPRAFMAWRKQENTGLYSTEEDSGYDDDSYAKLFDHGGSSSWTLEGSSDFERNNARDIQVLNKAGKNWLNGNGSYKEGNKGGTLPLGENIGWVAEEGSWRSINPVAYTLHPSNVLASLYMGAHNRALWRYPTSDSQPIGESVGDNFEKGVDIGHKVHFIGKTSGKFVVKPRLCAKLISGNNGGPNIDMTNDFQHSPYAGWNAIEDIVDEVQAQPWWNLNPNPNLSNPSPHLVMIGRDVVQWVLARNNVDWSNSDIDPGGPHNTVKENHIIPYNNDFVYYSVDEWSGHPGIIKKQLNSSHEDYGIVRARPNFGGPEIETPNTTYDSNSSSTSHKNPKGGWDGYTPPSWDDVGNGYYVFINRTFASPSYSEVYNPQFQNRMTADKKCKFRWYNWGCTAVRDRNGSGKLDPDGASDKWDNAAQTNSYTYSLNGQSITHNPNSSQAYHLTPDNYLSRNRFDYIMPDGEHYDLYDDGFKTLGDIVAIRKIGFEPGYAMSNIRGAKLFYQRASSTSHRQFLLIYGNQMQDFEEDGIPIMLVGYGGAYANILMDDIDICGNYENANSSYSYGNGNTGQIRQLFGYDVPIWSGHPASFSSAEGHTGADGGWDEDSNSFAGFFHFTWHNRSTSMMEVTGLSFETSSIYVSTGVGSNPNNPMCQWQTDKTKQSTVIGPDINAFILEEYDSSVDQDKKIGFAVSDIDGSKYYIGGFKNSNELYFNGASYFLDNDTADDTDDSADNMIVSDMFLDTAEYTKLLETNDGSGVSADIAFTSGTTVSYRMSLVYDGANESPLSSWKVNHTTSSDVDSILLTLSIGNNMLNILNPRVSGISLWRKHGLNANYTLVKSIPFDDEFWNRYQETGNELAYKYEVIDKGDVNSSFEVISGLVEDATNQYVHYKISTLLGGRLYAGNCWHPEMDDAETHLFRSEEAMYNTFNWADNNLNIKEIPIAMTTFAGRLFVWTKTRMHTIDPTSFTIIDTSEGISIFGQNSYVITEYGMFFADKNNIYVHDGSKVQPIAGPILHNTSRLGEKLGYQGLAKQSLTNGITPTVFYHGPTTSLCVTLSDSSSSGKIYKFNLVNKRWDLIDCPNPKSVTEGDDGDILIANEYLLYNFMADESTEYTKNARKQWRWDSKKFTMGMDTQDKVFRGINIIGTPVLETMTGSSSDNLRVYVDGTQKTLSLQNKQYGLSETGFLTSGIGIVFASTFSYNDITGWWFLQGQSDYIKPGHYIQAEDDTEILKVETLWGDTQGTGTAGYLVSREQMGTTISNLNQNEHIGKKMYIVSPRWKLPAGSKGKQMQIILEGQSGYVDSIGITYKPKGIK